MSTDALEMQIAKHFSKLNSFLSGWQIELFNLVDQAPAKSLVGRDYDLLVSGAIEDVRGDRFALSKDRINSGVAVGGAVQGVDHGSRIGGPVLGRDGGRVDQETGVTRAQPMSGTDEYWDAYRRDIANAVHR